MALRVAVKELKLRFWALGFKVSGLRFRVYGQIRVTSIEFLNSKPADPKP